jgi:hypothetical protein
MLDWMGMLFRHFITPLRCTIQLFISRRICEHATLYLSEIMALTENRIKKVRFNHREVPR